VSKGTVLGRIKGTTNIHDFSDCDLVTEAVVKNMKVEERVFAELGRVCPHISF